MGKYTRSLSVKEHEIWPEDENYRQELLDVARSFRTFDSALDEFIVQKGYSGDLADTNAKIKFIKEKFDNAGIEIETRILKGWFHKHIRANKREIAIKFCFAFQLTLEETHDFFRRVYLQRSFDCHSVNEIIYYYCISRHLPYSEAQALIAQAPAQDGKGPVSADADVLYTGIIIKELERFQSSEELIAFLCQNNEQFRYNNATAKKYVIEYWRRIAGENGLAYQEICRRDPDKAIPDKQCSVWEIYLQIFGLCGHDKADNSKIFPLEGDRTLQPILKGNDLIHSVVRNSFPDRQGLEEIIKGNWQSDEVIRKTLILLVFYYFWVKLLLQGTTSVYAAQPSDAPRCIDSINRVLLEAGYPELYAGNPYDWIFLFAAQDGDPLEAFRFFMREVYLNKEESRAAPQ